MDENPTETLDKAISAALNRSIARRKDKDASFPGRGSSSSSSIKENAPASALVPSGCVSTGASARSFRKTASPYDMMCDSDSDSDCLMPMFSGSRAAVSKASPQARGAFKQRQATDAPPGSTAAGGVNPRQTRHPLRDGGDGVGNDSKDSSGSEFEEMMLSSGWFSPSRGGPGASRAKNKSIIGSAVGDSRKRDARTNGDNGSTALGGSRGVAESEGEARGGKRKKQSGGLARRRKRRTDVTKKSRRARVVACASGEAVDAGSSYSDFSSSNGSGNSTSSANGDAPERGISSIAKGKATDRTRESSESSTKRSGAAALKPSQSPERRGKSYARRAERRGEPEDEHRRGNHDRRNKGVANGKGEDPARRQDGAADSGDGEAYGVGDPADRRGRKPARGSSDNVRGSFDDTSDGSEDSAVFHRRAPGDDSGSSSGGGGGRFGSNGVVGRRRRSRKDDDGDDEDEDDDDFLDDEEKLKPTLNNPPFEDPEMRPLVLENEGGGERAEVPAAVNRYLRGFQRDGVKFMWRRIRHSERPKGAILADDMGLGKTVQIVALLTALLKKTGTRQDLADMKERAKRKEPVSAAGRPVLLVCPSSVLSGWEDHLALWGFFSSQSILSSGGDGKGSIESVTSKLDRGLLEVVCVGYTLFTNNQDTLARYNWLLVVFDEVHSFKNPKTNRSQAVEKLGGAEVFIGLTGTLIQNELGEFWWIMNMIENGVLKTDAEFKQHFTTPILQGRKKGASKGDVELMASRLKELSVIRDKMVLRRTKVLRCGAPQRKSPINITTLGGNEEVLGDLLRGKTGTVVFCKLTPVQSEIYRAVLSLPEFKLLAAAADPCPCGRPNSRSGSCCGVWPSDDTSPDLVDPRAVLWRKQHPTLETCGPKPACPYCCSFPALTKLQKVSNHPSLLQVDMSQRDEEKRQHEVAFAEVAFTENARAIMADCHLGGGGGGSCSGRGGSGGAGGEGGIGASGRDWDRRLVRSNNFLQLCRDDLCGKMKTLKVLLKRFRLPAQKVLLFSYSTTMLDVLQALMIAEGYSFLRLDGSTPVVDRKGIIKRYNDGDAVDNFVFLISTRAGGTGLNLQSANKVILYDVNWNPTQDTQAEDRAYRIGQMGKVEVYRLVSTGTIEELTYMRQIYKLQTSAATMGDKAEGGLRQFEGVQGDRTQQGELWGISNLMRFSGESMLLRLRQEHSALPPIVPEQDGLVMEREVDMVDIVSRAAGAATPNSTWLPGGVDDALQLKGGGEKEQEQDRGQEDDEEEEEFDGGEVSGIRASEGIAVKEADHDDDLGGVVMLHDEMVAANRRQKLPEASQRSSIAVDITLDDEYEEDDGSGNERTNSNDGLVDGGGGLSDNDDATKAGIFSSTTLSSSVTTAARRRSSAIVRSQEPLDRAEDGRGGAVTSREATGDLCGSFSRPAATANSSTAVVTDADATQIAQTTALCFSPSPHGGGNSTTRAGFGVGRRAGSAVVSQDNGDIEGQEGGGGGGERGGGGGGAKEPDWLSAAAQQRSLLSPHTPPPLARDKGAGGPGNERAGVGGGGSASLATDLDDAQGSKPLGTPTGGGQPRWTWEQMGAQGQYLDLSPGQSVEVDDDAEDEEEERMGAGSGRDTHTETRSNAGDAHTPSQERASDCECGDRGHFSPDDDAADDSVFLAETQPPPALR